jgi:hypothetical protein
LGDASAEGAGRCWTRDADQGGRAVVRRNPTGVDLGGYAEHAEVPVVVTTSFKETTMTDTGNHLLAWLKDAHAAEEQAITMLSNMARRIENYPELKARIEQHVTETERQAERVRECLERHGSDASMLKEAGGKLMGQRRGCQRDPRDLLLRAHGDRQL